VPQRGDFTALTALLRDHLPFAARLRPEQRAVVEMASLVARVGYRRTTWTVELRTLCAACRGAGLTAEAVIATALAIRRAPGFIAVGPVTCTSPPE